MENQIEKLLNLGFDINKFYCISLTPFELQLQGHATGSLMNDLIKLGYELDYDKENNWFQCRKENVKITLTFKY